jgi:hypothetical protein
MPIRDIARRTVPVADLIEHHFDQLVTTTVSFATSPDPELRESVCKALQIVVKYRLRQPGSRRCSARTVQRASAPRRSISSG